MTCGLSALVDKFMYLFGTALGILVRDKESNELKGYRSLRRQNSIYHLAESTF